MGVASSDGIKEAVLDPPHAMMKVYLMHVFIDLAGVSSSGRLH
jgi:hypothetical protein